MNIPLITPFLTWLYNLINSVVANYGWTIVIMTILIKVVIMPLDIKQRRSMSRMQELAPEIEKINKKYKNDEQKKNEKTMQLYKENHVSPAGGCLPMLLSMLVLFGLYGSLRQIAGIHTVEMLETIRDGGTYVPQSWLWIKNVWQADNFFKTSELIAAIKGLFNGSLFTGGVTFTGMSVIPDANTLSTLGNKAIMAEIKTLLEDTKVTDALAALSARYSGQVNGLFILPVIATVSQIFSTKIMNAQQQNKTAGTSAQQQQSQAMTKYMTIFFPILTLWICASYNSVFSIYWVISNLWSIVQTVIINRIEKKRKSTIVSVVKEEQA